MNKIITFLLFLLIFILSTISDSVSQDISLPREVAEWYLEQEQENQQRKIIVNKQKQLILSLENLVEKKDSTILILEADKKLQKMISELSKEEGDIWKKKYQGEKKAHKKTKIKAGGGLLLTIALIILL